MSEGIVSIIVPNWNGKSLLRPCLDSIFRQDYDNFEVIVVDCASSDGSADFVRENYPQARLIALEVDRGPTHAINLGFQEARGEYLMSVTNDVILLPDTVSILVSELEKDDNCVISPTELGWDGRYHRSGGNGFLGLLLKPFIRDVAPGPFWPLIACCIFPKRIWVENPLNEHFFMYEELEWGWRLHLKGTRVRTSSRAVFLHKGAETQTLFSPRQAFLETRMILATCFICCRLSTFLLLLPLLFLYLFKYQIWPRARARKWRAVWSIWVGVFDFLRRLPLFIGDQRRVQGQRSNSDRYVLRAMAGGVRYDAVVREKWSKRMTEIVTSNLDSLSKFYKAWMSEHPDSDASH